MERVEKFDEYMSKMRWTGVMILFTLLARWTLRPIACDGGEGIDRRGGETHIPIDR